MHTPVHFDPPCKNWPHQKKLTELHWTSTFCSDQLKFFGMQAWALRVLIATSSTVTAWEFMINGHPTDWLSGSFWSQKHFQYQWYEARAWVIPDAFTEKFTKTAGNPSLHDWKHVRNTVETQGSHLRKMGWKQYKLEIKEVLFSLVQYENIQKIQWDILRKKVFWTFLCVTT